MLWKLFPTEEITLVSGFQQRQLGHWQQRGTSRKDSFSFYSLSFPSPCLLFPLSCSLLLGVAGGVHEQWPPAPPPNHPPPMALWLHHIVVCATGKNKGGAEVTLGWRGYYCVILYRRVQEGLLKEVAFHQRSEFMRASPCKVPVARRRREQHSPRLWGKAYKAWLKSKTARMGWRGGRGSRWEGRSDRNGTRSQKACLCSPVRTAALRL